jgi:hypothetical protein
MNRKEEINSKIDEELLILELNLQDDHRVNTEVIHDCFKRVFRVFMYMRELNED